MSTTAIQYRLAASEDLAFVVALYNDIIAEGGLTADTHTYTIDERREWFSDLSSAPCRIFIVTDAGQSIGYFYFTYWRKGRKALEKTAEITYYLHPAARGRGIGDLLVGWCEAEARRSGFTNLLAVMLDINLRSSLLLERHGFIRAGHLVGVAQFGKQTCGQFIYQKPL